MSSQETMEGVTVAEQQSVLIVDGSEETREVLKMALERRGVRTLATALAGRGVELARRHQPDLIVVDLELVDSSPADLSFLLAESSPGAPASLVMLGSVRRDDPPLPQGQLVHKPYHYGPLIRKIEELLAKTK